MIYSTLIVARPKGDVDAMTRWAEATDGIRGIHDETVGARSLRIRHAASYFSRIDSVVDALSSDFHVIVATRRQDEKVL